MHAYQPERLKAHQASGNPITSFVSENRALCVGAGLSVCLMSAIFVNAIWYQPGLHPSPMFATRNVDTATSASQKAVATVGNKDNKTKQVAAVEKASPDLVREVQSALSVRGYYSGELDGLYGKQTENAIKTFQRDHSAKQDGIATVRLLTTILLSASARPQEVPVPKAREVASAPVKVKTISVSAQEPRDVADGLVARIQTGLRAFGYDEVVVDGKMGQQTATAIQRFQLNFGMKITGEPSKGVLDKLSEIGAYKQG